MSPSYRREQKQGLCDSCHSLKTRAEENGEEVPCEIGLDGWPVKVED